MSQFRPNPRDELKIAGRVFLLAEHPATLGLPCAESGRHGTVYQLQDEAGDLWALKVFHPQFRESHLVGQAERMEPSSMLGSTKVE